MTEAERVAFGDRLFAIRERDQLRQVDFCDRYGVTLGTFKAMEVGRRNPLAVMALWVRVIELDPALAARVVDLERRLGLTVGGEGSA